MRDALEGDMHEVLYEEDASDHVWILSKRFDRELRRVAEHMAMTNNRGIITREIVETAATVILESKPVWAQLEK